MKFFSERNMIKFINFSSKYPRKKISTFSNLNMLQAAKYYNDQNNQQIYYYRLRLGQARGPSAAAMD